MKRALLFITFIYTGVYAQDRKEEPLTFGVGDSHRVIHERIYSIERGKKHNPYPYYNHPDFGTLPIGAPADKNLVEDISKRKINEHYYIDIDNPHFFYIQKSSRPLNFKKNGNLIAINPSLKQVLPNIYKANNQPCPTELNTISQRSVIFNGLNHFSFNHYKLKVVKNDNEIEILSADWSNYSLMDNECYIKEIFPGIDMRIKYLEGAVESDFIIKKNLNVKHIIFIDELEVSKSWAMKLEESILKDHSKGYLIIYDKQTGTTQMEISPAKTHDNSGSRTFWFSPYSLNENELEISCDSSILNSPNTVYPITVDPLVTSTGTNGTTYLSGTALQPASCLNTINITFPGGSVPWDVSARWFVYSNWCFGNYTGHGALGDDCWQSEAQVWLTATCGGRSPAGSTFWNCAGCNSTGTWNPTIAYNASGTQSLAQCFTPSCTDQTLGFNINVNRTNCSPYSNYDGCTPATRSYCQTLDNWSITVQGRTMETLNETTTGNGTVATTINCGDSYVMDPGASYGIAPYSYSWSSGGSGATKTITSTVGGMETHTVTVSDACSTQRTATFNIDNTCPILPVELISFKGQFLKDKIQLSWNTASEQNNDYFLIERSVDGFVYENVGKVPAAGNSAVVMQYKFEDLGITDTDVLYYRLQQVDKDGTSSFSKIIAVKSELISDKMICFPNPVKDELFVLLSGNYRENIHIEVYSCKEYYVSPGILQ